MDNDNEPSAWLMTNPFFFASTTPSLHFRRPKNWHESWVATALYPKADMCKWEDLTKEESFELCTKYKDNPFSLLAAVQEKLWNKNYKSHIG